MSVLEIVVQKRWKGLKDTFRRELKKVISKQGLDNSGVVGSRWAYFEPLLFLKDQLGPKHVYENIYIESPDDAEYEYYSSSALRRDPLSLPDESNNVQSPSTPLNRYILSGTNTSVVEYKSSAQSNNVLLTPTSNNYNHKRSKKRSIELDDEDNYSISEEPRAKDLKLIDVEDDDYHFLMSFLPHLRNMSISQKMWFRLKMQELLYNMTTSDSQNQQHRNTSSARPPSENSSQTHGATIHYEVIEAPSNTNISIDDPSEGDLQESTIIDNSTSASS